MLDCDRTASAATAIFRRTAELARICTFECTFCADCADDVFGGICPNCGGELVRRPIRPPAMLERDPASTERLVKPHAPCVRQNEPV